MSEPRWYYSVAGVQRGPVSDSALKELLQRGEVKQSDLVWRDGLSAWVPASRLRLASGAAVVGGFERTSPNADAPGPLDARSGSFPGGGSVAVVPPAGAKHPSPGPRKVPSTGWIRVGSFAAVWGLSIPILAAGWVTPSWCIGTVAMSAVVAIVSAVWAASESVRIRLRDHRSALAFGPIVVGLLVAIFWPVTFPWFIGERRRAALGTLPSAADGRSPHWLVVAGRLLLYLVCYFLLTLFVAVAFLRLADAGTGRSQAGTPSEVGALAPVLEAVPGAVLAPRGATQAVTVATGVSVPLPTDSEPTSTRPVSPTSGSRRFVRVSTTKGDMVLELDGERAPLSTANFLSYVRAGFYDGTVVHRVVPGFVVQGGGFDRSLLQKPAGPPIRNESRNGLKNLKGSISMARLPSPDSATSEFFINLQDNPSLDGGVGPGYAVFGRIVEGLEVLEKLGAEPTSSATITDQQGRQQIFSDVPINPIVILRATETNRP